MLILEPEVPLVQSVRGLEVGSQVSIEGRRTGASDSRFHVDFVRADNANDLKSGDIVLHFNPRFEDSSKKNCVVLNSRLGGVWGEEVRECRELPLQGDNSRFELLVIVTEDHFMVIVNGQHFADFAHRASFKDVGYLEIAGDVQVDKIELIHPPSQFKDINEPKVPLLEKFYNGLKTNDTISITGHFPGHSSGFSVNLVLGEDMSKDQDFPNIAFHFNPRVEESEKQIVLNDKASGHWGRDERRVQGNVSIEPGRDFELDIIVEEESYRVNVNGEHLTHFPHRASFSEVGLLHITGDVQLRTIKYSTK